MDFLYKIFRFFLLPLILLANFLQNNLASIFTPMNMGPVSEDSYSLYIKKNIKNKNFVLDFGSGAGFFSKLFKPNKYLGVEINKNFVDVSRKKNKKYKYRVIENDYLKNYENKIDLIFINNVLHHLTDKQILETFSFFSKKLKKKTEVFIIEPLLPKKFFSLEFIMKVLDIGNNIKNKRNYLGLFKKIININNYKIKKLEIGSVLVVKGYIKK
jgi:SAM-dependent methyltransferase|tara:strand:- start:101 stop:739 length:639 start_codon:yes stop_codon:yes gene_type:complete